jgi:galactose mutarotase-like enzyme
VDSVQRNQNVTTQLISTTARSEQASAVFDHRGTISELTLVHPNLGPLSLLQKPDSAPWPNGGMPLLFPFAGRVYQDGRQGYYSIDGKIWPMPIHGFAYAHRWLPRNVTPDRAAFSLLSTPDTQELFPRDFELDLELALTPQRLTATVTVAPALSTPELPCALGWHPYFRVPLHAGEQPADYFVESDAAHALSVTPEGRAGERQTAPRDGCYPITQWQNNILTKLQRRTVTLHGPRQAIQISWSDETPVSAIVLWTKPGFFCVEPWFGLPDAVHSHQGLQIITSPQRYSWSIEIV